MGSKKRQRKTSRWSSAEEKELRQLAKAKLSARTVAKNLKRTLGSITQKAARLGVSFRSIARRRL